MRIATLTWYSGNNYGSTMQAYALQETLTRLGHETEILSYSPTKSENWKLKFLNHSVKATVDYKINELYVKLRSGSAEAGCSNMHLFDDFRAQQMRFSRPCSTKAEMAEIGREYDAYICGSDQIWSPFYFDPVYALSFVDEPWKKIAYAPSFGVNSIPERSKARMGRWLKSINCISVREKNGEHIVETIAGRTATTVVDPTLLLGKADWEKLARGPQYTKPYIACYFLRKNEGYHTFVQNIAQKLNCEIRLIPMVMGDYEREYAIKEPVGPQQWLDLLKNAAYVVTDSFHCTLFSIIFQKNFSTFRAFSDVDVRSQNSRIDSLLKMTDMQDRIVSVDVHDIEMIQPERFEIASKNIDEMASASRKWLINAIDLAEKRIVV